MELLKWDIVYITRLPETANCTNNKCCRVFSIEPLQKCPYCNKEVNISEIIAKPRPHILWIDKKYWFRSLSFGIPLSKSKPLEENVYNEPIPLQSYAFLHEDTTYYRPMRAIVCQATRIAGNIISERHLLGRLTDETLKKKIESKLIDWLFPN